MATQSKSALVRVVRSIALFTTVSAVLALSGVTAAAAATVTLNVVSARTEPPVVKGAPISTYKYLINVDNTGTTTQRSPADGCSPGSAGYPASCKWTSIAGAASNSPIYAQGDQADIGAVTVLPGRYLISVLAEGYKLDGKHFTVGAADASVNVTVELQPYPLPDAQIQAAVFEDISPVNGAPDLPAERGLAGFQGHIKDYLGEVTTDVSGAPLCGTGICLSKCYVVSAGRDLGTVAPVDAAGRCPRDTTGLAATIEGTPIPAGAAIEGKIKIPNLGPNRYALSVTPPDGSLWVQTTTLEGNHDWDAWVMEGATGLDTEFVIAGEPFPAIIFGFVPATPKPALGGTGTIKGVVDGVNVYVPATSGLTQGGDIYGGLRGAKIDRPIPYPWVTLSDLTRGDTLVWVGQGNVNGAFTIPNVPPGNYTLTWWDDSQNYILDLVQVTVRAGETVDMGILPLNGWWTRLEGYVFNDLNRNGVKDPGEPGLPGYTLTMRKRENSLMDRGAAVVTTDANGYYVMENAYPMTQWLVMEAYDDLHYTTGVTFQSDNQPTPTTHMGPGVDVSVLPIIGLGGRLDWGKHNYDPTGANGIDPRNGGIVGTVTYDTTRNELDPRYAAAEDWQPGIPGLTVQLYAPVACGTNPGNAAAVPPVPPTPCDASGRYELAPDGAFAKGALLNTYVTETWQRPTGCTARNVDGTPLVHGTDEQVLPTNMETDGECLEGPLMGVQFGTYASGQGTASANFGASVDGNYGFGDGCFPPNIFDANAGTCTDPTDTTRTQEFAALPGGRDYLVEVVIPNDATNRPMYRVTREEDINIGNGDDFVPAIPPPACAGPLHTVDVAGVGTDGYPAVTLPNGIVVPASTRTFNKSFADLGGSPYEGMQKPLCNVKLVPLSNGRSIVPIFNLFTDVPVPARMWGLLVDDLNFSANPKSLLFGEKAGIPFAPVGIYDYTDRLVTTVESDYNGLFDVLLPSSNRINCPTPSGVCANLYRFVGNDPGVPGRLNLNYNPQFRTIAADFEAIPGLIVPADLAPTQVGVSVQLPGGQTQPVSCRLDDSTPQIHALSRPYTTGTQPAFTIFGKGFGSSGQLTLDGTPISTASWSDTRIDVTATISPSVGLGPHQLHVTTANGMRTVNGLTFYRIGGSFNPQLYEVGPESNPNFTQAKKTGGRWFTPAETLPAAADHVIQRALDAAPANALVVVYPNLPSANPRQNPRGAYYENLIITKPVKLQGVGPGSPDGSVPGSIIDGGAFAGDSPVATDWYAKILTLTWAGNQTINDGAVVSIYTSATAFPQTYAAATVPSIDGFDLRGGNQQGFPGNINTIGGGPTGLPPGLITQGGAIFANGYARNLQITNNVVQNNGGAYGTIRIGTPDLPTPTYANNHNENIRIANNRVIANAGTNLAGGIGLFTGSDNYEVAGNDICGNFSAEYGGGISVVGYSPYGRIHDNRIYFNRSYDEGGGVMIAGILPADPATLSPGSGPVDIYNNQIQANMALDDGGGIRFLMAGNYPMNVYNNFIVNNVSAHEGGGVSLNDAPNVRVFNNTIMKNLTTATAITSTGAPAPAGLSTSANSQALQATLPAGSPTFSNPLLFNNIFWDNRAGTRAGATVTGLGLAGDTTAINNWDLAVADGSGLLSPTNSVLQVGTGTNASPTNIFGDPGVVAPYDTSVAFQVWRNNPAFVGAILVAVDLPPNLMGNYHLAGATSVAVDAGAAGKAGISAPASDIDGDARPASLGIDIGADEVRSMPTADLRITMTDGVTVVPASRQLTYTVVVSNAGPNAASGATVTDIMPAGIASMTWTCAPAANCTTASGSGSISATVNLAVNSSATFTVNATVAATATGSVVNTATVAPPAGVVDPNSGNNSATDTDTIPVSNLLYADLQITMTDGVTVVPASRQLTYTVVVSNAGPNAASGATVTDIMPAGIASMTWTCAPAANCTTASGSGSINATVNLLAVNSTATFTVNATVAATATGSVVNTATVAPPAGVIDPNLVNNSATDTNSIFPALALLDNFNRGNANTLGPNWQQRVVGGSSGIRTNANNAYCVNTGADAILCAAGADAYWAPSDFGSSQAAAFTFANTPSDNSSLILKASGTFGVLGSYANQVRVRYSLAAGGQVIVETTTDGSSFTTRAAFAATFANNNTLTAMVDATGTVYVWKTAGTVNSLLGQTVLPEPFATGAGRLGMNLPAGARVDNFSGAALTP